MRLSICFPTCFATCQLALAQVQPPTPPARTPPIVPPSNNSAPRPVMPPTPLYRMNDISKSMNLTADQIANLNRVTTQAADQFTTNAGNINTLGDADRFTRINDLNNQYHTAWFKGARDIFNDNQFRRYRQLNYQYGGFNTFYDPEVQKQLNLTADQVQGTSRELGVEQSAVGRH